MTATKIQPGDDTHLTLLMAPHSLNFVTGADRAALLAYGRDVFAAARDSKCLAQIEEPAQPVCWIRFCSDGSTEGPIMHSQICEARKTSGAWTPLYAGAAPAAVAPRGEYPHEQMDAMALDRYKVVPSNASMLWSHAVVAGDGTQQLYVGREVECQNMVRKFAGAFLDGAFAFHSTAAAPTAQAAPALDAPAAPADTDLRKALQFYANGEHFILSERDTSWDTVSGEPQNYWCDEAGTATVEDGTIAKMALAGHPIDFEDDDAAPALEAPAAPATSAQVQALHRARRALHAIGKTYDDIELRTRALEADEEIDRLLAAAPQAPAAPAEATEAAGKAHDWRDNASYGGETCAECGATKGSRRGNAPCTWPPAKTAKRWPFLESPGEFTARLEAAIRSFGSLLPAVRNVLIERPPTLAAAPAAPAVDESFEDLISDWAHGDALDAEHYRTLSQAARDVLAERRRQVNAEGFSPERDDQYVGGQLAGAAISYLILAAGGREDEARAFWPWRQEWLKPGSQRRYLEKACALGLAEMERMDRSAALANGGNSI